MDLLAYQTDGPDGLFNNIWTHYFIKPQMYLLAYQATGRDYLKTDMSDNELMPKGHSTYVYIIQDIV